MPVFNLAAVYFASGALADARELLLYLVGQLRAAPPSSSPAHQQEERTWILVETGPTSLRSLTRALPDLNSLTWAVAELSIALADWPVALDALKSLVGPEVSTGRLPTTTSTLDSVFERSSVSWLEVHRAYALTLLSSDRPHEALRVALQVADTTPLFRCIKSLK